jgi:hypothetical protein
MKAKLFLLSNFHKSKDVLYEGLRNISTPKMNILILNEKYFIHKKFNFDLKIFFFKLSKT